MTAKLETAEQVAERYGMKRGTVYGWVRDRRVPFIRVGKKTVRFDPEALDRFLLRALGPNGEKSEEIQKQT